VTNIAYNSDNNKFTITAMGHDPIEADYCFSNMAIPFLKHILDEGLVTSGQPGSFSSEGFIDALKAVYKTQEAKKQDKRFLACTTKVGWQADRSLWQGNLVPTGDDTEVGVVPIYGGISWTKNPITQVWYPSEAYHDQKGVLTGTYNFGQDAVDFGNLGVEARLDKAKEGAGVFGEDFAAGLDLGVTIAWQNIPYIRGGWTQWHLVGEDPEENPQESVDHFNSIIAGTGIVGGPENRNFFIVGDQASSLPGWQEGAVASALNALKLQQDCNHSALSLYLTRG
jgi:monoamine oxidase